MCSNEETLMQSNMDVARIPVKTKYCLVLNQTFNVEVNNNVYMIKLVEDNHILKRIVISKEIKTDKVTDEESEQDDDYPSSYEVGDAWRQHEGGDHSKGSFVKDSQGDISVKEDGFYEKRNKYLEEIMEKGDVGEEVGGARDGLEKKDDKVTKNVCL